MAKVKTVKVENRIYPKFKSYKDYIGQNSAPKKDDSFNFKPIAGASIGVGSAMLIFSQLKKNPENILNKLAAKLHLKESGTKTLTDVSELIFTAGAANIGAIGLNSIGKSPEVKKKKWKEAGFQMMNMAIPMLMTTAALKTCEATKALNNNPAKIIGSIAGMVTGAFTATQITNLTKKEGEPKRKYTIKDSVANFDDIVATIKIGFSDVEKIIPVSKIIPFIYIYSASRAGSKGDEEEI